MRFRYFRALLADLFLLGVRSRRCVATIVMAVLIAMGLLLTTSSAVVPAAIHTFP